MKCSSIEENVIPLIGVKVNLAFSIILDLLHLRHRAHFIQLSFGLDIRVFSTRFCSYRILILGSLLQRDALQS